MIRQYLKLAWADLTKHKFFSFLNIAGLAFGISLCMVVITIIRNQLAYDSFHPHPEKTYRVNTEAFRKNGSTERYATSPLPLANYLKDNYAFVADAVSLTGGLSGDAQYDEKTIFISGFFSDASFFNLFGYKLKYGDAKSALSKSDALVLTYESAVKLFGHTTNPVGLVLSIKGLDDFIISGVLEEPKGKSHLEFDAIGSKEALPGLENRNKIFPVLNKWENYFSTYTYVLLQNESDKNKIAQNLDAISNMQSGQSQDANEKGYKLYSQPVYKIIPGPVLSNNMGKALPEDVLWYLAAIGIVVIVSAGYNYNSLTLARALGRAKEIGIRKTAGARKYQLVIQFLVQSVVAALAAMVAAALFFHYLLRPFIENIGIFKSVGIILYEDMWLYLLFTIFAIIVGLLSGLFPALYLSSFNPLSALRNASGFKPASKISFRRVLLSVQFGIALFFVIGLVNISRQV
ncbi:MAG: ABC transporter permease, partial [Methylobacter sp.]